MKPTPRMMAFNAIGGFITGMVLGFFIFPLAISPIVKFVLFVSLALNAALIGALTEAYVLAKKRREKG